MNEVWEMDDLFSLVRDPKRHVEVIDRDTARLFIERIHYSRLLPSNVVHSFGLYEERKLIGVVTYGIPASPALCRGLAGGENKDRVLELNRLAIENGYGGENRASFLISHSLKMLPNNTFVVSYADTGWTHVGYVYQASNFLYTGLSAKRVDQFANGLHPRQYKKGSSEMRHQTRNPKHRYVYLVGNKRERERMRSQLRYPILPYPKGDETHYDTDNPQIVIPIKVIE
jgi:hypothetical protein